MAEFFTPEQKNTILMLWMNAHQQKGELNRSKLFSEIQSNRAFSEFMNSSPLLHEILDEIRDMDNPLVEEIPYPYGTGSPTYSRYSEFVTSNPDK